ncbi:MAG: hypothetical protein FD137_767 [Spirochaetes bacterium]|nr:MAG: hypothetical protein FD137_767 [Spirochaetota bacterium]
MNQTVSPRNHYHPEAETKEHENEGGKSLYQEFVYRPQVK